MDTLEINLATRQLTRRPLTDEERAELTTPASPIAQMARRSEIAATYAALPVAVRVAFAGPYVQAERFLDLGQWDVAIGIIEAQQVPPELQTVKDGFIASMQKAQP